jgi:hypothetical protein
MARSYWVGYRVLSSTYQYFPFQSSDLDPPLTRKGVFLPLLGPGGRPTRFGGGGGGIQFLRRDRHSGTHFGHLQMRSKVTKCVNVRKLYFTEAPCKGSSNTPF